MPSVAHVIVGLTARRAVPLGGRRALAVLALAIFASIAPDFDIVALPFDLPDRSMWGHRGASHSIAAAAVLGVIVGLAARWWRLPPRRMAAIGFAMALSHLALDCLNVGSIGVPWLWPLSTEYFGRLDWQPIPSVIRVRDLLTWSGVRVMLVELVVFSPVAIWALWRRGGRGKR